MQTAYRGNNYGGSQYVFHKNHEQHPVIREYFMINILVVLAPNSALINDDTIGIVHLETKHNSETN